MVTNLMVLLNLNALVKILVKRGLTPTVKGQVWSDELSAFVSVADAFLAGLGKARKSKDERGYYNLLLEQCAMKEAQKFQRGLRDKNRRPQWDKERLLDILVNIQERMSKGMKLINKAEDAKGRCSQRLQAARDGERLPKAEWVACLKGRDEWKKVLDRLWECWKALKADSNRLASEHGLWPMYWSLVKTTFQKSGTGYDERPATRDQSLEWNDKPSGLTGQWEYNIGDLLSETGVEEQSKFMAAHKAAEYGKRWKTHLKTDRRPSYTRRKVNGEWVLEYRHTANTDKLIREAAQARYNRRAGKVSAFTQAQSTTAPFSFQDETNDEQYMTSLMQEVELFVR